jgi:Domain of unknown function (DUF3854)
MQVAPLPTTTAPTQFKYKTLAKLEKEAQRHLARLLSNFDGRVNLIPQDVRAPMITSLRSLAQQSILDALEARVPEGTEDFSYEWEDAFDNLEVSAARSTAADLFLAKMPDIDAMLKEPEVKQRILMEWLLDQTAGRIQKFTPYLVQEEQELQHWKDQCPAAFLLAQTEAQRASQRLQDGMRPNPLAPSKLTDQAKEMSYLANMIAARKLYLSATGTSEYFEGSSTYLDAKVPRNLLEKYGNKVYVRFGDKPKPIAYRTATQAQTSAFRDMLSSSNQMLNNLQQKLMPWTAKKGLGQKTSPNLMARVYYEIVKPGKPEGSHAHQPTLEKLKGNESRYRILGFREDITPAQAAIFEEFMTKDEPTLKTCAGSPSVQAALRRYQLDKSLVQLCLNAAVAEGFVEGVKAWRPHLPLRGEQPIDQAKAVLPAILQDLPLYHSELIKSDYVAASRSDHFKPKLQRLYEAGLPAKERAKLESFCLPIAVVLVAKQDGYAGPMPANWRALETYTDSVTQQEFTDYSIETPKGKGIICLIKGGAPESAQKAIDQLLDLKQESLINDSKARIKGVRMSELFFNELRSSCLHAHSIARTQFYTSFSMPDALEILRGSSDEPTMEHVVEALNPCSIFRYTDNYCRVKPSRMVRVKYRTPTGEATNPCWDASQALGGLSERMMQERHENPEWSLIFIEGEKKAAMLAQMAQDEKLPFHIIAIPGVWMALKGPKGAKELSEFFDEFAFQDTKGNHRNCLVFFDNDKAYNVSVTEALVQTGSCLQRKGADVFIPNLPFGKKIKGADDFAQVHCRKSNGIDYKPLVDIIERAVYVPVRQYTINHQTPEQQRDTKRLMQQAEQVHELQARIRKQADPLNSADIRKLVVLQGPSLLRIGPERQILETFDRMEGIDKQNFLERAFNENGALRNLQRVMTSHIPNFDTGTTLKEVQEAGPNFQRKPTEKIELTPDMFTMG